MSIFRRGGRDTGATGRTGDDVAAGAASAEATDHDGAGAPTAAEPPPPAEPTGPFDVAQVGGPEGRLDLGSLWVDGQSGMELRLEIDQEQQQVVGATAVIGESAVQLQAFAAPKSGGLWAEIREEIAASIVRQGGTAQEKSGAFGRELSTRMPSAGPDGRTVFAPARFVGVDGPRWFLRAVFSGRAAIDDAAAQPLFDVVRNSVVVRGNEPMAPREMLPLTLPTAEEVPVDPAVEPDDADGVRSTDDLNPFERGPEITEVH